jgi:hypothetical protein
MYHISATLGPFIASLYKSHVTSRWNTMIYKVVPSVTTSDECGLICYARPDKGCRFYMHNAPDCYLGDFSNTNPATGLTGTFTIYINYGNFYAAMLMLNIVHNESPFRGKITKEYSIKTIIHWIISDSLLLQ